MPCEASCRRWGRSGRDPLGPVGEFEATPACDIGGRDMEIGIESCNRNLDDAATIRSPVQYPSVMTLYFSNEEDEMGDEICAWT